MGSESPTESLVQVLQTPLREKSVVLGGVCKSEHIFLKLLMTSDPDVPDVLKCSWSKVRIYLLDY